MPPVANCQLAVNPRRPPPCSGRKLTALPNSPATENPCNRRATVMMIGAARPIVA